MTGGQQILTWAPRLFLLNLLWVAFTALGLVVLGIMPATVAVFSVTKELLDGEAVPIFQRFLALYRLHFVRANLLGLVLLGNVFTLLLLFTLVQLAGEPLLTILGFCARFLTIIFGLTLANLFPVYIAHDGSPFEVLRDAFLVTINNLRKTIIMGLVLVLFLFAMGVVPVLIPFFFISLFSLITIRIFDYGASSPAAPSA